MKYLSILPIIGHGSTDLVDLPLHTLLTHFMCFNLVKKITLDQRRNLLIFSSIIHLSNDFFFTKHCKLIVSGIFHYFFIRKPIIFKFYMNFYHTPLHYLRSLKYYKSKKKIKIGLALLTTLLSIIAIKNNIDKYLEEKYGQFWWVSPIFAHIIINEIINHDIKLFRYQNLNDNFRDKISNSNSILIM